MERAGLVRPQPWRVEAPADPPGEWSARPAARPGGRHEDGRPREGPATRPGPQQGVADIADWRRPGCRAPGLPLLVTGAAVACLDLVGLVG
ncbi:hypothetical protein [Streptomyces sp. NBC_00118]|uniref:hypothetical protein n=1 Tax=Streptomyces sp. NBC_00118 TaxID=2975658 RepID=UPI00308D3897|nr:hypothetical protein OG518_35465 [Streptomyces sp. NBC_01397]